MTVATGIFVVALLAIGLFGGTCTAPVEPPAVVERDGYLVLRAELHAHTRLSDGFLSPAELVFVARRRGIAVLGVTEHNHILPAEIARWVARRSDGPLVIVGEEVTTRAYHLLAYGLRDTVVPRADLGAVIDEIHRQGGVAVAAHPVCRFWPALMPHLERLDGVEVVHPVAFLPERDGGGFRASDMVAFYERARPHGVTAVGSSDFHFFGLLGVVNTFVFVDPAAVDRHAAVLDALRRGRTVVRAPDGTLFGAPDLVTLVERRPLPPPPPSPYPARSLADGVTRAVGFAGALLLLLGRVRRRAPSAGGRTPAPRR